MTILGTLATRDWGVIWTDSETLRLGSGEHYQFRNKLLANALAGMVCASSGWSALGEAADGVAAEARDLDHAMRWLPDRLRQRCAKLLKAQNRDPREVATQRVILLGWSPEYSRVIAVEFTGAAFFEPVLISGGAWPMVPEFHRL